MEGAASIVRVDGPYGKFNRCLPTSVVDGKALSQAGLTQQNISMVRCPKILRPLGVFVQKKNGSVPVQCHCQDALVMVFTRMI